MAPKRIIQSFESFTGVDLNRSPLSADQNSFTSLLNMEPAKGAAIRGRRGSQISNAFGNFIGITGFSYSNLATGATTEELLVLNDNFFKEKNASFTITRVAGAVDFGWEIQPPDGITRTTFRFVLTQGGAAVTLVHPITLASNPYLDLGTGLEDWFNLPGSGGSAQWPTSVLDLIQAIDNTANFSVSYPADTARVSAPSGAGVLTVQAGHTVSVGDIISVFDTNATSRKLVPVKIVATTATTLTYENSRNIQAVTNQTIGQAATPAAAIKMESASSTTTGAALTVPYQYWQGIVTTIAPYRDYVWPFESAYNDSGTSTTRNASFRPPTFVGANSSMYVFTETGDRITYNWEGYPYKYDRQNIYRAGVPEYDATPSAALIGGGGLSAGTYYYRFCYRFTDNNGISYTGVSKLSGPLVAAAGNGGDLTLNSVQTNRQNVVGTVTLAAGPTNTIRALSANLPVKKNDFIYIRDTATGDYVNRLVTSVVRASGTEVDITFSGPAITVALTNTFDINPDFGYNFNCAIVNGAQTNVGNTSGVLLTVYNNALVSATYRAYNTFNVGDTILLFNNQTGVYETRVLTVVTPTTLGWDLGPSVSVSDTAVISCNLRVCVYRTKVGSTKTYFVTERPNNAFFPTQAVFDSLSDAQLGEEFVEPELGKEPNALPRAGIGCSHQGKIIYSRIKEEPNTIAWSDDVAGLEAVPLASNYADVPATIGGPITAIGSDADNKLAVFKDNAYYDASGDLESGAITIIGVKEGDYGVAGQGALKKINGVLIGIGKLGIVAVARGQVISDRGALGNTAWISDSQGTFAQLGERISPALINNSNLVYAQAMAINDYTRRVYNFYVPSLERLTQIASSTNSISYVYPISYAWDYGHQFGWFDREYACFGIEPSGGFAVHAGECRYLSTSMGTRVSGFVNGAVFRFIPDTAAATISAADNHFNVRKVISTYALTPNSVSFDSQFQQIKLFRFIGSFETKDLNAFVMRLRTYRNFQSTTIDSTRLFSFTTSADNVELFNNLNSGKARGMIFYFDNSYDFSQSVQQIPYISGYEIITDVDYDKEDYHE